MKKEKKQGNIGISVKAPQKVCSDEKCPFHGNLNIKKKTFVGVVTSSKPQKTCIITWHRKYFIPKYERYEIRKTKINAHNPPCIDAREKDIVRIIETRPLSKTKNFVVIEKLGEEKTVVGEDLTAKPEKAEEHKTASEKTEKTKK